MQKNQRAWLLSTVGIVAFLLLLTFPKQECPGDAVAARVESVNFIKTGKFEVPAEIARGFGERGQYFVENTRAGKWVSKYGAMNTLIYVPALLAEKIVTGKLEYGSAQRALFLNLHNLLIATACAAYLFLLACRYTKNYAAASLFVGVSIFSTFWWNHLRIQAFEAHHGLLLLAAFYHFLTAADGKSVARNLCLSAACFGILCLTKAVFGPLLGICTLACYSKFGLKRTALLFVLPAALLVSLIPVLNYIRIGAAFDFGYTQWAEERHPFSGKWMDGLTGFLFDPQFSIFITFPPLIIALWAWPRFFKGRKLDSILILASALFMYLLYSKFLKWAGQWSYGPRYMLPILPLLSLPCVMVFDWLLSKKATLAKSVVGGAIAIGLLYSTLLQIQVNSLPFYTFYYLSLTLFNRNADQRIDSYFNKPFGVVLGDFTALCKGTGPFPPVEIVKAKLNGGGTLHLFAQAQATPVALEDPRISQLEAQIKQLNTSNYYFW